MKISIVVPVYNVAEYLEQCLTSLINQTYQNLEIICINDGSSDGSLAIVNSYSLIDERIKVIDQENKGLSGARNAGIDAASGDYILFVDSDDWLDLDTCESLISIMLDKKVDVVLFPYLKEYDSHSKLQFIFEHNVYFSNREEIKSGIYRRIFGLSDIELSRVETLDSCVTATCKLYSAKLIKGNSAKFLDTKLIGTEDAHFNMQVFSKVSSAFFINKGFYHYRKTNDNSLTSVKKIGLEGKWHLLFKLMQKHIITNGLGSDFQKSLDNRISLSIIGLGLNEMFSDSRISNKYSEIVRLNNNARYKCALKNLNTKNMKFHWKFFFFCLKSDFHLIVLIMLYIIKKIIRK